MIGWWMAICQYTTALFLRIRMTNMKNRDAKEILLTLLRTALTDILPREPMRCKDWNDVLRLAMQQDVAAVAWQGLETLAANNLIDELHPLDKGTKLQWAYAVERCVKRYNKQKRAIKHLAEIYAEREIRMMILKGYGLSLCYPTPEYRPCCDVDIWLYGDQQRGDEALRETLGLKIDADKHTVFHIDGVMVENHFDFLNIHSHLSNRELERELLRRTMEESLATDVEGERVYLPPVNMHALFLVRHAAAHFAAVEIVLRHVVDWAMFIKAHHSAIDWKWLYEVCREHKMDRFLDALNAYAIDFFDIDAEHIPSVTRRTDIEARILADILQPEFSEQQPDGGLLRVVWFKCRRWWANRWKHRLVYRDGLISTFLVQVHSHLLKPKTLRH